MRNTFIIVEDHKLFAEALQNLISQMPEMESLGMVTDSNMAVSYIENHQPDFIFLDLNMPNINGIDIITSLRTKEIKTKIIIVSMLQDSLVIFKALDAGADGFIPKNTSFDELKLAIETTQKGGKYVNEILQTEIDKLDAHHNANWEDRDTENKVNQLGKREIEILKLVAHGYNNSEIAEKIFLSPLTIKTHRHNILKKLGLKNSAALVKYASDIGLI